MALVDAPAATARADVCLVLEGTYPYVKGGVSNWVHNLIGGLPELQFTLVHVGPEPGAYSRKHYSLPANVMALTDLYCRERLVRGRAAALLERAAQAERRRHARARRPSRVLNGIRRLHLEPRVDSSLLDDLATGDLSVAEFLHGRASFDLIAELHDRLMPEASFLDFFWHYRSMHMPLVRLLAAEPPAATAYHALCTGYAGLLAAAWSQRTGRPLILTEHGIYSRERNLEMNRAAWLRASRGGRGPSVGGRLFDNATVLALRRVWIGFFRALARCAYERASSIISLCEVNRARQIADGAPADRTMVIPNGIDLQAFQARLRTARPRAGERRPTRVGFVGRLVSIKDIITFIHACSIASRAAAIEVLIFGPTDEEPRYARRCRRLVAKLGLEHTIHFERTLPAEQIYREIDMLVLTSFSEGQPLVILEAGAAGIPVVASDVGACREQLEGRDAIDRSLGPSGVVTRLAAPQETAAAIVRLARDPELRRRMGAAGQRRVATFYRERATLSAYRTLYVEGPWRASAGDSSA